MLKRLKRPEEALASYDRALALKPEYAEALKNCGNVLSELNRPCQIALNSANVVLGAIQLSLK